MKSSALVPYTFGRTDPKTEFISFIFFFLPRLSNSFMLQPLFWQLFERRIGKRWGFGIKESWIQNLVFITFLLCFLSREGKIILTVGTRFLGQTAGLESCLVGPVGWASTLTSSCVRFLIFKWGQWSSPTGFQWRSNNRVMWNTAT